MKSFLLYLFLLVLSCQATAQVQLSGTVYDSTKRNLVEGVQVICTCGTMSFTDSVGSYTIFVGEKDSVFFFFRNKPTQMFPVASIKTPEQFDISINLFVPGRYKQLKEIIVYGKTRWQDSIENRVQYDKIFNYDRGGIRLSNTAPESGFGAGIDLNALVDVFRFRRNRSMLRFQQRLIKEEQDRYIDYRFNKTIVQKLTTLREGPSLEQFMKEYRPEYELLTQILDIELYMYIQAAARDYMNKNLWRK
ncbi:MAG TPA: hypothetical protein VFV46_00515 [Lacibacter sp.]|nr:hypothetical protein [Lacibacter sp.]